MRGFEAVAVGPVPPSPVSTTAAVPVTASCCCRGRVLASQRALRVPQRASMLLQLLLLLVSLLAATTSSGASGSAVSVSRATGAETASWTRLTSVAASNGSLSSPSFPAPRASAALVPFSATELLLLGGAGAGLAAPAGLGQREDSAAGAVGAALLGDAWRLRVDPEGSSADADEAQWRSLVFGSSSSASALPPRLGAVSSFLRDFGVVLLFGGQAAAANTSEGAACSPPAAPFVFANNLRVMNVASNTWSALNASAVEVLPAEAGVLLQQACDGTAASFGPPPRAHAAWHLLSEEASPNDRGDPTVELLLYGGVGLGVDSNSASDGLDAPLPPEGVILADLWKLSFSRRRTSAGAGAGAFYARWEMLEQPTCVRRVCNDSQSLVQRAPEVISELAALFHTIHPASSAAGGVGVFRPSDVTGLLFSLRAVQTSLAGAVHAAQGTFESLPPGERMDDPSKCAGGNGGCTAFLPKALVRTSDQTVMHPPPLKGHGISLLDNASVGGSPVLVVFGGSSCSEAQQMADDASCYSNTLWLLDVSTGRWSSLPFPAAAIGAQSNSSSLPLWPSARAFHSQVSSASESGRVYVFGGRGDRGTVFADLWALDLDLGQAQPKPTWSVVKVAGTRPPALAGAALALLPPSSGKVSATATAVLFGGQTSDGLLSPDTFLLRLGRSITAQNIFVSGPALEGRARAGQTSWVILETKEYLGNATSSPLRGGAPLSWGTSLRFVLQLVNEDRVLTQVSSSGSDGGVVELGHGRYNASFTLTRGWGFQMYVLLQQTQVTLDTGAEEQQHVEVLGSPFAFFITPSAPSALYVLLANASASIRGQGASLDLRLFDRWGNILRTGGCIAGAINATTSTSSEEPVAAAPGQATLVLRVIPGEPFVPGQVPKELWHFTPPPPPTSGSNDTSQASEVSDEATTMYGASADLLSRVDDHGDGRYTLHYQLSDADLESAASSQMGEASDRFQLLLYFNGRLFGTPEDNAGGGGPSDTVGSGSDAVVSPPLSTALPLTLSSFSPHELPQRVVYAMYALAGLCALVVLVFMLLLVLNRHERVIRASSVVFLLTLCLGALVCFLGVVLLGLPVSDSTCQSYPIVLGLGIKMLLGSLFVKSRRIMAIFTQKKLVVMSQTQLGNLRTAVPLLGMLGVELVFAAVWLLAYPLRRTERPYVHNAALSYVHCDSEGNKSVFVTASILEKALLGAYGVFLATKTRRVPQAYNESKLMVSSLYNIAFIVLICFLVIYLTEPDDDLTGPFVAQSIAILWGAMGTVVALIGPKLYYLARPPPADFYTKKSGAGGVAAGGAAAATGGGTGGATISAATGTVASSSSLPSFSPSDAIPASFTPSGGGTRTLGRAPSWREGRDTISSARPKQSPSGMPMRREGSGSRLSRMSGGAGAGMEMATWRTGGSPSYQSSSMSNLQGGGGGRQASGTTPTSPLAGPLPSMLFSPSLAVAPANDGDAAAEGGGGVEVDDVLLIGGEAVASDEDVIAPLPLLRLGSQRSFVRATSSLSSSPSGSAAGSAASSAPSSAAPSAAASACASANASKAPSPARTAPSSPATGPDSASSPYSSMFMSMPTTTTTTTAGMAPPAPAPSNNAGPFSLRPVPLHRMSSMPLVSSSSSSPAARPVGAAGARPFPVTRVPSSPSMVTSSAAAIAKREVVTPVLAPASLKRSSSTSLSTTRAVVVVGGGGSDPRARLSQRASPALPPAVAALAQAAPMSAEPDDDEIEDDDFAGNPLFLGPAAAVALADELE